MGIESINELMCIACDQPYGDESGGGNHVDMLKLVRVLIFDATHYARYSKNSSVD
jgi:hypothetical protein